MNIFKFPCLTHNDYLQDTGNRNCIHRCFYNTIWGSQFFQENIWGWWCPKILEKAKGQPMKLLLETHRGVINLVSFVFTLFFLHLMVPDTPIWVVVLQTYMSGKEPPAKIQRISSTLITSPCNTLSSTPTTKSICHHAYLSYPLNSLNLHTSTTSTTTIIIIFHNLYTHPHTIYISHLIDYMWFHTPSTLKCSSLLFTHYTNPNSTTAITNMSSIYHIACHPGTEPQQRRQRHTM